MPLETIYVKNRQLFQVEEAPATNGSKNGKESSKEPDSIDDDEEEDVDIDDI